MAHKQESSFHEIALNYQVNQECSCKISKGFGYARLQVSEYICNLTRYNNNWKEDESG